MFFSIVIGGPVVFHLLVLLFSFLKSSFDTLVVVKRRQLIEEKKRKMVEKKTEWTILPDATIQFYNDDKSAINLNSDLMLTWTASQDSLS